MKNTDLRIGNFVYGNAYNGKITVFNNNQCVIKHKGGIAKLLIEDLKPIPLSEEMLLKCGFEDVTSYKDFWLTIEDDLRIEIALRHGGRVYTSISDMGISSDIKYLHQLQNLYFALTQTELEVSL